MDTTNTGAPSSISLDAGDANPTPATIPLDEPKPTSMSELHQKGVTAALVAIDKNANPNAAYNEVVRTGDTNTANQVISNSVATNRKQILADTAPYMSNEDFVNEANSIANDMTIPETHQAYVNTVKGMPSAIGKDSKTISDEAVYMQLRETLSDLAPHYDWHTFGGTVSQDVGLLGSMIPARTGYTVAKLVNLMGFGDFKVSTVADPTTTIQKLRNTYASADNDGKKAFLKVFANSLNNATDNKIIRGNIASSVLGPSFDKAESHFFSALDDTGVAQGAFSLTKVGMSLAKAGSIINTARRLKALDTVAAIEEKAVEQPEAAAEAGVPLATVGDLSNPLLTGDARELLTGAPMDDAAEITKTLEIQNDYYQKMLIESERRGIMSPSDMQDFYRQIEIQKREEPGVIDAKVEPIDESRYKLRWTEAHTDSLGRVRKRSHSITSDITVNDMGDFRANPEDWVYKGWTTLDPNAMFKGALRQTFVTDVEHMDLQQSKTAKVFDNMMKVAFSGLDKTLTFSGFSAKKSASNVMRVLEKGAKEGVNYNYSELVDGTAGTALSPKEARAYIGVRNVLDKLHILKNKQLVDNYVAHNIHLYDGPDYVIPVRHYEDANAAKMAYDQTPSHSNYVLIPKGNNVTLGKWKSENGLFSFNAKKLFTKKMMEKAYERGYVLARNHAEANYFSRDEAMTEWALIKRSDLVSPRGKQVLNKIPGYLPKIRTGAYWFIKKMKPSPLTGAKDYKALVTEAYADTRESADKWVAMQHNPEDYQVFFDRQMPTQERQFNVIQTHGGLYSGARKSTELPFVGNGDSSFIDGFEAIQHYVNHIGRQYPASLYRIGSEKRLIDIARGMGVKGRDLGMENLLRRAEDSGIRKTTDQYKMLKALHDQLSFVNMTPTDEEMNMAAKFRTWGQMLDQEWLNKVPGWEKVPKFFYRAAAKNIQPINVVRGITFAHMLGLYNPAQILVQYSGALVSLAIDPVHFAENTARGIGWSLLDNIASDPESQYKAIKWLESNGLGDYAKDYELWARSGYRENVEHGNADYTSVISRNMPFDEGVLRKISANHTIFYKAGELANTRTAFATAVRRYKVAHGLKEINPNDSAALNEIITKTEQLRLNMSRANQSALNRGYKSIPLQFQQVVSKYLEKVLPQAWGGTDEFTKAEKLRLFTIPTIATGLAGFPAGEFVANKIMDMFGIDQKKLSPDTVEALNYGFIGWMNHEFFNINVDFSTRMSLGTDIPKAVWDGITKSRAPYQMLGPAGTIVKRYVNEAQYLATATDVMALNNPHFDWNTVEAFPAIVLDAASDIPTVTRNAKQYFSHIFYNNPRFMKQGRYMWDSQSLNKQTAFFATIGFQPTEQEDMYNVNNELNDSAASYAKWGDSDAKVILRLMNTRLLNGDTVKNSELGAQVINGILNAYGPIEQAKLLQQIYKLAYEKRFDQGNLFYKYLQEEGARQQHGLDVLSELISKQYQERNL